MPNENLSTKLSGWYCVV